MRALITRVLSASVEVDGETVGSIDEGFLVLLGVVRGDGRDEAELLARKTAALRVFCDENDKMNLSLTDVGGGALVVSQFTLCADTRKGNRPSFDSAAPPDEAKALYEFYSEKLRENGVSRVENGVFGAHMMVGSVNNGPVTIMLDTDTWSRK